MMQSVCSDASRILPVSLSGAVDYWPLRMVDGVPVFIAGSMRAEAELTEDGRLRRLHGKAKGKASIPGHILVVADKLVHVRHGSLRLRINRAPMWRPEWVDVEAGETYRIPAGATHLGEYEGEAIEVVVEFDPPCPVRWEGEGAFGER